MEGKTEKTETLSNFIKEIDKFVEMGTEGGGITEETMTPPLPKSEIISEINNKYIPFSSEGVEERCEEYLEQRKKNLIESKNNANNNELEDIQSQLDIVSLRIENNKIKDRFEILDL